MNHNNKNNKTVIRAERVAGSFTTIPHRIIHDKRLSTDTRLLLISILSDADSFDFSRTGLCKRLGLTEYRLDNALKELITFGYLKKTKRHGRYFHYTISEFGNLNKNDENLIKDESVTDEIGIDMDSTQFEEDWERLTKYFSERYDYVNIELIKKTIPTIQTRGDVFELRRIQDKEIQKNKKAYYKELETYVNNGSASKELKPKILKELKQLITDEHKKPTKKDVDKIRFRISHDKYKNKVKKYGFDYETQLVDSYENSLD